MLALAAGHRSAQEGEHVHINYAEGYRNEALGRFTAHA
jgi:hypothetical protein